MSVSSVLTSGRAAAEAVMLDSCIVTRGATGPGVFNPETGLTDFPEPTVVYEGRCKLADAAAGESEVGEHVFHLNTPEIHVPALSGPFAIGDRVEILTSPFDPANVGRKLTITALMHKSLATSQRLPSQEIAR